jgi:HlyD family secretion protein/macrolide-specific efflux system membrane fusion protein
LKKILILLLAAGLAAGGFAFWRTQAAEEGVEVLESGKAERAAVKKTLEATGIIKPEVGASVKIGVQATGKIEKMLVKVGDEVRKNQLVAKIDDRELRAALAESKARLERALAELDRVRTVYPLSIAEARSDVEAARAEAEYAAAFLARQKRLFAQDLVSRDTLDDAAQKARVKTEMLRAGRATLNRIETEFAKELRKAEKSVAEAEAAVQTRETRLSYTEIYSPIRGVVSQVAAQEGETAVAGLQVVNLITVLDPKRLEMWIYVDETDVGQVEPGLPVEFTVDAHPDRTFEGSIAEIYPEPEIRDNIVYYRALVRVGREQAEHLRPEMTTQCRIVVEVKEDVLSIPNAALKWVQGEQVVFRIAEAGGVSKVKAELGLQGRLRSEVLSGLSEGDAVATRLNLPSPGRGGGR